MENGKEKYDLILFSVPDTHSLAGHRCFTLEMMRAVKKRLNPGGVFAMRLSHLPGYPEEAVSGFRRITASTVSNVFPHVLYTTGRNSILMASTGMSLTLSPDSLEKALEKCFSGKKHHIPSGLFFVAGPGFSKNAVRIDGNKTEQTVTTERSPKLLIHSWRNLPFLTNLKFLVQMYEFMIRHSSVILIFTLILYLVIRYFLTNRIDVKMLFFSFETGFFVFGTLSLLCFFFQIRTGELYLNMTTFLGLFSLGALLGKCIKKTRMIFILFGFLPFAAYLSSVLENLISAFVIYLSIFLLGICFGNAYDCFRKRSGEEKLSVFLPVAALSGGAIGLFLVPCIFLPVYGILVCILLLFLTRFSRMLRG